MANQIWVYVDLFKGKALPASWEAVTVGRTLAEQLGGGVTALVFGSGVESVAQEAVYYGADEVLLADDPSLADYRPEPLASLITQQAQAGSPQVILLPTTTRGRELAGMVAIDLDAGVLVDVVALEVENGKLVATRPVYGGKLLAKTQSQSTPQIVTLRGRAFGKPARDEARTGTINRVEAAVADSEIATKVVEYKETGTGVSLTDASVIVSGGRGTSNNPTLTPPAGMDEKAAEVWRAQQGFQMLGDLAAVMNGAVGASRAAVDAGYVPYSQQVGQTGKVVSPDLYIAAGISGAIQHQAGMRTSKVIVAVNKDPEAPIFKMARYGVVGDLYQIIPELTEALKQRLGK